MKGSRKMKVMIVRMNEYIDEIRQADWYFVFRSIRTEIQSQQSCSSPDRD